MEIYSGPSTITGNKNNCYLSHFLKLPVFFYIPELEKNCNVNFFQHPNDAAERTDQTTGFWRERLKQDKSCMREGGRGTCGQRGEEEFGGKVGADGGKSDLWTPQGGSVVFSCHS